MTNESTYRSTYFPGMCPRQYKGGFNGVPPDRTIHPIMSDGVIEGGDNALSGKYVLVIRNFHGILKQP